MAQVCELTWQLTDRGQRQVDSAQMGLAYCKGGTVSGTDGASVTTPGDAGMTAATTSVAGPAGTQVHVVGAGAVADAVTRCLSTCSGIAAPAVVVVPRVPEPGALAGLSARHLDTEVAEPLTDVLLAVQQALPGLRAAGGGRLVFVLPVGPVMGEPSASASAAVVGGVLSMARTLAIELGRDGVTVNVVVVDPLRLDELGPALADQFAALLGRGGAGLTGQEIYVTGGVELGRLRP